MKRSELVVITKVTNTLESHVCSGACNQRTNLVASNDSSISARLSWDPLETFLVLTNCLS